jgi:hypothetical protein
MLTASSIILVEAENMSQFIIINKVFLMPFLNFVLLALPLSAGKFEQC